LASAQEKQQSSAGPVVNFENPSSVGVPPHEPISEISEIIRDQMGAGWARHLSEFLERLGQSETRTRVVVFSFVR